jgi:starvation-inducible DNA-binding protein
MTTSELFNTRIDLEPQVRARIAELCNRQLADLMDLYSQTKHAHWNVKGPQFYQLHELFDELAAKLQVFADEVAERCSQVGGVAQGTVRMAAAASRLPDFPLEVYGSMATVDTLAARFGEVAASTREAINEADEAGDQSTADLFTEVSRGLDKSLWFLEAHLQN